MHVASTSAGSLVSGAFNPRSQQSMKPLITGYSVWKNKNKSEQYFGI